MPKAIVRALHQRELGVKDVTRCNQAIMRELILDENTTYSPTCEVRSKRNIFYDAFSKMIFMDKYRTCYKVCGRGTKLLLLLYGHGAINASKRIEDTLMITINFPQEHFSHHTMQVRLSLTKDNWLHVNSIENGECLQSLFLSEEYMFRHLTWETEGSTIVLKSTRDFNKQKKMLCALMFFRIYPFEYIGTVEISKEIFGTRITDAEAMDGLLIICEGSGLTRIYDLNSILEQRKFVPVIAPLTIASGKRKTDGENVKIHTGDSLKVNIFPTEAPDLLFEATSKSNGISIEGYPFQYIVEPLHNTGTFKVYTVCPPHEIENNTLRYPDYHFNDSATFHPDNSGRILHLSCYEFSMFKVIIGRLQHLFTLWSAKDEVNRQIVRRSASGRQVRTPEKVKNEEGFQYKFCCYSFENDVDLLCILIADKSNEDLVTGTVNLYNNSDGKLIKTIKLEETWQDEDEQTIFLDLDILIHVVKTQRNSVCYVYHLSRIVQT